MVQVLVSLIAGYPGQTRQTDIPTPNALQTGLSRLTLAGGHRLMKGFG